MNDLLVRAHGPRKERQTTCTGPRRRVTHSPGAPWSDARHRAGGVIDMLVQLSGQYDARDVADQLLVLREDVRDPALRARGDAWIATLITVIEDRLPAGSGRADGLGKLIVAHWHGTLTVWSFSPDGLVMDAVRASLGHLCDRLDLGRVRGSTADRTSSWRKRSGS